MTVRRAVLIVLIGALGTNLGIPVAEFVVWPSLVDPDSIERTVSNIRANENVFLAASFAYLAGFVGDILVAWALYFLMRPVSPSLSALASAFRAVQAVVAIGAALNLFTAFRLLQTDSLAGLGATHVHAHVLVLLQAFGHEWSFALVIFGIHLGLLGLLVYRSQYIPRVVGVALVIAGAGYVVYHLRPYLYPDAEIGFVFAALVGELVFVVWLALWGWRIAEPVSGARADATRATVPAGRTP